MSIPDIVKEKAKGLVGLFGEHFVERGSYDNCIVYQYVTPSDICTGFPFIYLYDPHKEIVEEITGFKALDIISFINN